MELYFPNLVKLKPTIQSTVLKAMEEYGELCREVRFFNINTQESDKRSENLWKTNSLEKRLEFVLSELLDVAQCMFTVIYFMQETKKITPDFLKKRLHGHLSKLIKKGYVSHESKTSFVDFGKRDNGDLYIRLPKCDKINYLNVESDIMFTLLKLGEEIGELAQVIGKHSGLSGEVNVKKDNIVLEEVVDEMLDVAQTCCTLLYIFQEKYDVDVESFLNIHRKKLEAHGYY